MIQEVYFTKEENEKDNIYGYSKYVEKICRHLRQMEISGQ